MSVGRVQSPLCGAVAAIAKALNVSADELSQDTP